MGLLTEIRGTPYILDSLHQLIEESDRGELLDTNHNISEQLIEPVYQALLQFYINLINFIEKERSVLSIAWWNFRTT
ncbi:MAG: hypothetical protein ACFFB4_04360 [Promethearchaeota archaeon]